MALDLKRYRAIQQAIDSPTPTETRRREALHNIRRDFEKSLSVDTFKLFDKMALDQSLRINAYSRKYSHYNGVEQSFTALLDTNIEAGDIIYCDAQDEYWVTITSAPIDYIYRQGIMFLCDTTIKWQDDDGNIWEYPVVANNTTQYNSGVFQGKMIDYVTSQHKLITTADENILNLKTDTRFIFGKRNGIPDVYRLTQLDTTHLGYGKGIAMLTLLRTLYNPETDNIETGICITKEKVDDTPDIQSGDIEITVAGKPQLIIGDSKTVKANTDKCTWAILETVAADLISIVPTSDNTAILDLNASTEAFEIVGQIFTVACMDESGNIGTRTFQILGGI